MDCVEDLNCVLHTSGGRDIVSRPSYSKDMYVTDFDRKNDKVFIDTAGWKGSVGLPEGTEESWHYSGATTIGIIPILHKQIALEGASYQEIKGWIDVAKNGTQAAKKENPIFIK